MIPFSEGSGAGGEPSGDGDGRRYDSFLLRVWHAPAARRLHRVEVQHLQTGLVEAGIDPTPEWILAALLGCLAGSREARDATE
jgi:hypothetical protein